MLVGDDQLGLDAKMVTWRRSVQNPHAVMQRGEEGCPRRYQRLLACGCSDEKIEERRIAEESDSYFLVRTRHGRLRSSSSQYLALLCSYLLLELSWCFQSVCLGRFPARAQEH